MVISNNNDMGKINELKQEIKAKIIELDELISKLVKLTGQKITFLIISHRKNGRAHISFDGIPRRSVNLASVFKTISRIRNTN